MYGVPLFTVRFEGDAYLLSLNITRAGSPMVTIVDNELVFSAHLWDVTFEGTRLKVRDARGDVYTDITFAVPGIMSVNAATFESHGRRIEVATSRITTYPDGARINDASLDAKNGAHAVWLDYGAPFYEDGPSAIRISP